MIIKRKNIVDISVPLVIMLLIMITVGILINTNSRIQQEIIKYQETIIVLETKIVQYETAKPQETSIDENKKLIFEALDDILETLEEEQAKDMFIELIKQSPQFIGEYLIYGANK